MAGLALAKSVHSYRLTIKHNPLLTHYSVSEHTAKLNAEQLKRFEDYQYLADTRKSVIDECLDAQIDVNLLLASHLYDEMLPQWSIVETLLHHGANVNLVAGGNHILFGLSLSGKWKIVRLLLTEYEALGCFTSISDNGYFSQNLLSFAAQENEFEIVQLLMDNGAYDHPCWDMYGDGKAQTAAQRAETVGHHKIARYIEGYAQLQNARMSAIESALQHILPTTIIDFIAQYTLWTEANYGPIYQP